MDRNLEIALLSDCLQRTQANRPVMSDDETLVPVSAYLDEERFAQERELVFRRALNVIAHGSQIASPGDFITRDLLGTPVILVRDRDGVAKAFVNVCRHRGATVELRDQGNCKRFVCPYHAWTYRTDGALASVRHQEGFPSLDVEGTSLVPLRCVEEAGLIWVCPDPHLTDCEPDQETRRLFAELEGLGCAEGVVFDAETRLWKSNWKLIVDGGLESYHFRVAHRDTVAGFFADNISTFEFIGDHIRTVLPRTSIVELAELPQDEWDIRKHTHIVYAIAPNATILMQERHFELILATPVSATETRVEVMTIVPKPRPEGFSDKAQRFWTENHAFTKKTLAEDFEIGEQIQRGMRTGANEFFRFARFEGALTEWHRRLDSKLGL